ncbi:MAG: hypothetical protein LBH57_09370, partial [Treponema sp.]|nr:hypothetical protein [Treponema sp.]
TAFVLSYRLPVIIVLAGIIQHEKDHIVEAVPNLIDCGTNAHGFGSASCSFSGFQPCETVFFKGCCSKTEVLEQALLYN